MAPPLFVALAALLLSFSSARGPGEGAGQLFVNGNIYTMDAERPRVEAMLVVGDRVAYAGSEAGARARAAAEGGVGARVVDLGGRTVLPGLIDAHGHVAGLGAFGLNRLDLSRAGSFEELVATVGDAARAAGGGKWVVGGRWDHESWTTRELPRHAELSLATPENPVWLRRVDGHAGLANAAALRIAGVTRETVSPPGGEILKDEGGEPTGVLVDNAMSLVERHAGGRGASGEELILKAQEMCLSVGLTGVHDAGISPADAAAYRELEADGRLKMRVYAMISGPYAMRHFESVGPVVGGRFTCRAAKLYMDGAMGSRGAWLMEPYADRPADAEGRAYTGLAVSEVAFVEAVASHALGAGFQVCTHAIGDRANREVLGAYERALAAGGGGAARPDHRFRIEHAQLIAPGDVARFAALGVVASMQPTHCTSDMRWVEARVGAERARGAYAWASLLRSGAVIAGGSDFPVESHNPFLGLYAAVTRQDARGNPAGGWRAEERMTREEALRAFTLGAAYAAFEEKEKGSLEAGKLADFIVIDRDVMTCEVGEIAGTRVLRTVIGGETVYEAR